MEIWDCYHRAKGYVCKIASAEELNRKWDYEIAQNPEDGNWLIWKEEAVENFKKGVSIPYYGILNGTIICEATAVTDPQYVQNGEGMMGEGTVYLCAFRTNPEFQGQGYFSKLKDFMLEYYGKKLLSIVEKMRQEIVRRSDLFEAQTIREILG